MRESEFTPIRPGQNPYASETNRLQKAVVAASEFSAPYGYTGAGGHHVAPLPETRFLIKLTSKTAASDGYPDRYAWEAMLYDTKGNLITGVSPDMSSDATGFPAIEVFARDAGTLPVYYEAWIGYGDYLLFDVGCCGTDCDTSIESFTNRTPSTALATDKLLASDSVNHVAVAWPGGSLRQLTQATSGFHVNTDAATVTFDLTGYTKHQTTAGGNRTYALANEYANAIFSVRTIQNVTGGWGPTFWSGIRWMYGTQPPVIPLANAVTDLHFERLSAGNYRHLGTQYWIT